MTQESILAEVELPEPVPPAPSPELAWRRLGDPGATTLVTERIRRGGERISLGALSSSLANAGLVESTAVALAGAYVLLPAGVRIAERYAYIVERAYEHMGLEKHEYSALLPPDAAEQASPLARLAESVLFVTDAQGLRDTRADAVLCPSGELAIYPHWRARIREHGDLPVTLYRRCSYFRPSRRSGQGVFRTPEARDMFELHCAFATPTERRAAVRAFLEMYQRLAASIGVPMRWSTRPPWTNNEVAMVSFGGDVALPSGATIQAGCLYDQGTVFSERLGIRFRDGAEHRATEQVAGSVSRRLLFAHLFLGLRSDGSFLLHPNLAPDQVVVSLRPTEWDDLADIERRLDGAALPGVDRVRVDRAPRGRGFPGFWRVQGVPLTVMIQGRRHEGDGYKLVLLRADSCAEAAIVCADPMAILAQIAGPVVAEVAHAYAAAAYAFSQHQRVRADSFDELAAGLRNRRVVSCALAPTESAVRKVASLNSGEVLGFVTAGSRHRCVATNQWSFVNAYVSPRI